MTRGYQTNGETMVAVRGRSDSVIASLTELGLAEDAIRIQIMNNRDKVKVDAYGDAPPESQFMGASAAVSMTLVHFDRAILNFCIQESWGSTPGIGQLGHAGSLMGNNLGRFAPGGVNGNHFIGLNLLSAAGALPWRFYFSCLGDSPVEWPIGTKRSLVSLNWDALPYSVDPWNGGNGSFGVPVWDNTSD